MLALTLVPDSAPAIVSAFFSVVDGLITAAFEDTFPLTDDLPEVPASLPPVHSVNVSEVSSEHTFVATSSGLLYAAAQDPPGGQLTATQEGN